MMKKILTILFLAVSLNLSATDYYVRTDGSNSNDGLSNTAGGAWLTLSYACAHVSAGSHTIHVAAGTYTETAQSELAVGVSIEGAGSATTIIDSRVTADYSATLSLYSETVNTNGNQHISGLKFTGYNKTAWGAILVRARGNVSIYDCEFEDFSFTAVIFNGLAVDYVADEAPDPGVWSYDNRFYNNRVDNCSQEQVGDWMSGSLHIGSQDGMLIYNNIISDTTLAAGSCGYPIKYYCRGFNRDLRIYDNEFYKTPSTSNWNDWNFAIELWEYRGGVRIYNNIIEGSIDIDHVEKNAFDTALVVRGNIFGYESLPPSSGDWSNLSAGVYIEFACEDIYIHSNTFQNLESPFRFSPRDETVTGVHIYNNIINQIGNTNSDAGCNLMNFSGSGFTINDLWFVNNTIYAGSNNAQYGMILPEEIFNNTTIRNNIFVGFETRPIEITGTDFDYLYITNNVFYGNGTNSANVTGSPTNYTNANNLTSNPSFVSAGTDFHLAEGSPAIGTGIGVGLNVDYDGNLWNATPSIGAYEYDGTPPDPPGLPEVTTGTATYTAITANVSYEITSDGGGTLTNRGVCWSTSANPTISNSKTIYTSSVGSFTDVLRGLSGGTTYHVRAYTTNESGTAYGADYSFTTPVSSQGKTSGKIGITNGKIGILK